MKEFEIANGDKVEKVHVALLFKNNGSWVQLAKATENTVNLNPETENVDFIVDKNPTTLIKKYKPSLNNPLTMFKGEPDYECFFNMFYNLPTGADANGEVLVVYMNEKVATHQYKAWRCDATFVLENLDPVNSQLTVTTQFNGTIDRGTVTVTNGVPTFASDDVEEFTLKVVVADGDGATVTINGMSKVANADGEATFNLVDGVTYTLGAYNGDGDKYAEVFTASSATTTKNVTLA